MSNLTDFFPTPTPVSPWGPAGDPDLILNVLSIGGGAGASCSALPGRGGGGGGVFWGFNVAGYSGVAVPVTVGSGGAGYPPTATAGTPTGKGSPGTPSTFGCVIAYGGGTSASGAPTTFLPADAGGASGNGYGMFCSPFPCISWNLQGRSPYYQFTNKLGIHQGNWYGSHRCGAGESAYWWLIGMKRCTSCVDSENDPKYPCTLFPCTCWRMPGFYCLDIDCTKYCTWSCLGFPTIYDAYTAIGTTRCIFNDPGGGNGAPGCAGTGKGGVNQTAGDSGSVWVVYPCNHPATPAPARPGSADCTPCAKTGYYAYKFTSPGSFTLP